MMQLQGVYLESPWYLSNAAGGKKEFVSGIATKISINSNNNTTLTPQPNAVTTPPAMPPHPSVNYEDEDEKELNSWIRRSNARIPRN